MTEGTGRHIQGGTKRNYSLVKSLPPPHPLDAKPLSPPPHTPAHESCQAASQLMTLPVQPAVRGAVRVHAVMTAPPPYLHMSPARQPASS